MCCLALWHWQGWLGGAVRKGVGWMVCPQGGLAGVGKVTPPPIEPLRQHCGVQPPSPLPCLTVSVFQTRDGRWQRDSLIHCRNTLLQEALFDLRQFYSGSEMVHNHQGFLNKCIELRAVSVANDVSYHTLPHILLHCTL